MAIIHPRSAAVNPVMTTVLFDSRRRPRPLADVFGHGLSAAGLPASMLTSSEMVLLSIKKHRAAGRLAGLRRGASEAPAGATASEAKAWKAGYEGGAHDLDQAWEAGRVANLADAAPTAPRYSEDELTAAWLDGWKDSDAIQIARWDAIYQVETEAMAWDEFCRRHDCVPSDDALMVG